MCFIFQVLTLKERRKIPYINKIGAAACAAAPSLVYAMEISESNVTNYELLIT